MVFMTDYSAWKFSASTILFLIGCGWHNRILGYRKLLEANRSRTRQRAFSSEIPAAIMCSDDSAGPRPQASAGQTRTVSMIWNHQPPKPGFDHPAYEYTGQLVNLNRALNAQVPSVTVGLETENAGAAKAKVDKLAS